MNNNKNVGSDIDNEILVGNSSEHSGHEDSDIDASQEPVLEASALPRRSQNRENKYEYVVSSDEKPLSLLVY